MTIVEFARRIHMSRRNAYDLFKRETIDTRQLETISDALEENLFFYYIPNSDFEKKGLVKDSAKIIARLTSEKYECEERYNQLVDRIKKAKYNKLKDQDQELSNINLMELYGEPKPKKKSAKKKDRKKKR